MSRADRPSCPRCETPTLAIGRTRAGRAVRGCPTCLESFLVVEPTIAIVIIPDTTTDRSPDFPGEYN